MRLVKLLACAVCLLSSVTVVAADPPTSQVLLPPRSGNPRNSEGDFVFLNNGKVLLIYPHFTGGAGDHAQADLASRISDDGGKTWGKFKTLEHDPDDWYCYLVSSRPFP